jgi:hypothetical protein
MLYELFVILCAFQHGVCWFAIAYATSFVAPICTIKFSLGPKLNKDGKLNTMRFI